MRVVSLPKLIFIVPWIPLYKAQR